MEDTQLKKSKRFVGVSGIISGIALLSVVWFILAIFSGLGGFDKRMATKIPEYPSASKWDFYSSSGFPGGHPDGGIYFYSNDEPREVASFYRRELSKMGMELSSEFIGDPFDANEDDREIYVEFKEGRYNIVLNSGFYSGAPFNGGNYWLSISHAPWFSL